MFNIKDDTKATTYGRFASVGIEVPVIIMADSTDADAIVEKALQIPEPWFKIVRHGGSGRDTEELVIIHGEAPNLLEEKDPFADPRVATVLPSLTFSLTLGQIVKAIAHYAYHFDVDILRSALGGFIHGMHILVDVEKISPMQASAIIEIALYGDVMFLD
jgi:hypothetical protein